MVNTTINRGADIRYIHFPVLSFDFLNLCEIVIVCLYQIVLWIFKRVTTFNSRTIWVNFAPQSRTVGLAIPLMV